MLRQVLMGKGGFAAILILCSACADHGKHQSSATDSADKFSPPAIASFIASETSVMVGNRVTLSWKTTRAKRVELLVAPLDSAGSSVAVLPLEENLAPNGGVTVVMDSQKTFELVAHGHDEKQTLSGPLTVYVTYPQMDTIPDSKTMAQTGFELVRDADEKPVQANGDRASLRSGEESELQYEMLGTLAAPLVQKPRNGTVFSHYPRELQFSWGKVGGASAYGVEVDCYQCCVPGQWCRDTGRVYHIRSPLRMNAYSYTFPGVQRGRWRVWSIDGNGNAGPRSDWSVFRFTR